MELMNNYPYLTVGFVSDSSISLVSFLLHSASSSVTVQSQPTTDNNKKQLQQDNYYHILVT